MEVGWERIEIRNEKQVVGWAAVWAEKWDCWRSGRLTEGTERKNAREDKLCRACSRDRKGLQQRTWHYENLRVFWWVLIHKSSSFLVQYVKAPLNTRAKNNADRDESPPAEVLGTLPITSAGAAGTQHCWERSFKSSLLLNLLILSGQGWGNWWNEGPWAGYAQSQRCTWPVLKWNASLGGKKCCKTPPPLQKYTLS